MCLKLTDLAIGKVFLEQKFGDGRFILYICGSKYYTSLFKPHENNI